MVLIKIKKTNLATIPLHIFLFFIPFISSIISGCAQRTGRPPLEFKIIEFFPPAGFQMPLTSVPLKISIAFSKPVDQLTINDTTIKVFKDGNEIKKEIKITDRQKIELFPEVSAQGKYKVFVSAKVKSIIGEELGEDFSWEFTITPITPERVTEIQPPEFPPLIKKIYPEHGATVPQDTIVYVVFSKKIINLNTSNFYIQDINGRIVDADLTYLEGENIAILKPKRLLEPSQTYIVNLRSNITAQDGETLGVNIAWIFFTSGIGVDTTPPDVISIFPPNGATGVPIDTKIIIFFSEDIDTGTITSGIKILENNVVEIPFTFSYDPTVFKVTITPLGGLTPNRNYIVKVKVKDKRGNEMPTEFISYFSTGTGIGVGGPGEETGGGVTSPESPQVIITSPSPNSYVKGIMNVEVSFTGSPKRIELWINAEKKQTITSPPSSPITFTEDTRTYTDGEKIVKVIGYYSNTTTSYSIKVTFDNSPPSVSIQEPTEGKVISGTSAEIRVITADSPDGRLEKVELYIDEIFHSSLTSPTIPPNIFKFFVDTTAYSDGNHTIEIKAKDLAGNEGSSGKRNIKIDNTPPSGFFISPSNDSVVGGAVNVEVNASDNIGVSKVIFFANAANICDAITGQCEITSSPYRIRWDSTSISYSVGVPITAAVFDLAGNTKTFGISVTVDNVLPVVAILNPAPSSYLKGSAPIDVFNSDTSGVTRVVIIIDSTQVASAINPPSTYTFMWNTLSFSDGTHSIKAIAYDKAGNSNTHEIFVVVDNTPPVVSITNPLSGSFTNANSINIGASASDNILLDRVEFYIDGVLAGTDSTSPFSILADISLLSEGTHSITAVAFDVAGNNFTTPSPTTFIIDRTPPTVGFTAPTTGAVVQGTITVNVVAVDLNKVSTISITAGTINLPSCTINASSGTCSRTWATSGDQNNVILTGIAGDSAGNQGVTQIVVMIDNLSPSVSVTSPTAGYVTCPTNTVLGASASDANQITAVVIRLVDISTSTELASFTFSLSPTSPANVWATLTDTQCGSDGQKRVEVRAFDAGGRQGIASRNFTVDNTPPGLNITFPPDLECVGNGITRVVFTACDSIFLNKITVYVDSTAIASISPGTAISCSTPQPYNINWNSSLFSDGSHQVRVVATDLAGNSTVQIANIIVDNNSPTINIINPPTNSLISAPTSVLVTLGDSVCPPPTFPFKKVEYQIAVSGVGSFSSSTQSCSSTQRIPCTDTNVGSGTSTFSWSATEYCGFFIVKAVGYDYVGNKAETTATYKIHPVGCPIDESWSPISVLGSVRTTPILRDLNADGKIEIIFGTEAGRVYAVSEGTNFQNGDAAGSPIRGVFLEALVTGIKKLVFGTGGTDRKIRALNLTSSFLSSFASVSTETAIFSPPSTLYTDGSTTVIIVGDLRARVSEYVLSAAGFTLRNCYPAGAPLDCGLNSAPITDLNGDGRPDIISSPVPADFDCDGSYDTIIVTASDGYITAIDIATRTKNWTVYTGAPLDTSPIVADFNNDCDFEILVATKGGALYCISETGEVCSSAGWSSQFFNAGAQIVAPPAVTDVDSCLSIGDPQKEIIFGNTGGNLYILSQLGTPKYSPPRNLGSFIVSTPAIADINGDGCGEIFVATGDGRIHGFYLVNRAGQIYPEYLTGFPKSTGGPISAGVSPVICDIDGDSAFELIIGNDSSQLRVYDLGSGSAGAVKWIPGAYFCTPDSHACQRRWETAICGQP
ncbi:MAG: Ig-like domain-containing protein [Candidatus Calescibacterium sp.]|jgi:hypothetical protein|nr:Ig-like domain-containing protein [Candidatus Calescibacterium sp.]